jgi:hypothetical protein
VSPWLPVRPDTIPAELRALPWVLWRPEPRWDKFGNPDKPDKVPYRIADPTRRASHSDPATWGTFEDAVEAYGSLVELSPWQDRGPIAGMGVVLTAEARVTCIDLDRVIADEGQLDPRAEQIITRCHSWTEISPSGTGVHVFVKGRVARALKGNQIEVYGTARYICVTGQRWPGTPAALTAKQDYLDYLVRVDTESDNPRSAYSGPSTPPPDDLAGALLAKLAGWGIPVTRARPWSDGYLVELPRCPWADEHTTGSGGAVVMIHASGAFDFTCLHAHCARRTWRDFRATVEGQ